MVLLAEPLARALAAIRAARAEAAPAPVISFSPAGTLLHQAEVRGIATSTGAVLLCARYEGVDQRFIDAHVDVELSVGDYVLSGGELPALILLDAIARLQPGVLGDARSHEQDSFSRRLARLPPLQPPGAAGRRRRRGPRGPARRQPWPRSTPGAASSRSLLTGRRRPDLIAAARAGGPDRRPGRGDARAAPRQSYNFGFFDPLPRWSCAPTTAHRPAHRPGKRHVGARTRSPGAPHEPDPDPRARRDRSPRQDDPRFRPRRHRDRQRQRRRRHAQAGRRRSKASSSPSATAASTRASSCARSRAARASSGPSRPTAR